MYIKKKKLFTMICMILDYYSYISDINIYLYIDLSLKCDTFQMYINLEVNFNRYFDDAINDSPNETKYCYTSHEKKKINNI